MFVTDLWHIYQQSLYKPSAMHVDFRCDSMSLKMTLTYCYFSGAVTCDTLSVGSSRDDKLLVGFNTTMSPVPGGVRP